MKKKIKKSGTKTRIGGAVGPKPPKGGGRKKKK